MKLFVFFTLMSNETVTIALFSYDRRNAPLSLWNPLFFCNDRCLVPGTNGTFYSTFFTSPGNLDLFIFSICNFLECIIFLFDFPRIFLPSSSSSVT